MAIFYSSRYFVDRIDRDGRTKMTKALSRREILYCAGGLLTTATLRAQAPASAISPIMTRLSTFMSAAATATLPAEVVEKTKHMILDTLAAMISGSELPPGRFAINFVRAYKGDRIATVAGSNVLCGPIEAALANGMLAHSDETDDSIAPSQSHPGCAIFLLLWPPGNGSASAAALPARRNARLRRRHARNHHVGRAGIHV